MYGVNQNFVSITSQGTVFAPIRADLGFIGEREASGAVIVQEELPESLFSAQVFETAPTRRSLLEVEGGNSLARFVSNRQQASLRGLNDRLVNRDDIEVNQAAPELE